jgi:serine/threonine-protein kinase
MSVIAQAAHALHAAHTSGIVHRDVKPANLLVQPDGTVILVDFGVAYSAADTRLTGVNDVIGTALYMAPEQISKLSVTPATDVYALGAVAYHCLAGHPPFTGGSPLEVALRHLDDDPPPLPADVPAPIQAVIARAMAKNPADRYPSAAAFAAASEAERQPGAQAAAPTVPALALAPPATAHPPVPATTDRPAESSTAAYPVASLEDAGRSRSTRRRWALMAAAMVALLLGLTAALAAFLSSPPKHGRDPARQPTSSTRPAATAQSGPTEVSGPGSGIRTSGSPRTPATSVASAVASSPAQPSASTSPTPSPPQTPAASSTSQPANQASPSASPASAHPGG